MALRPQTVTLLTDLSLHVLLKYFGIMSAVCTGTFVRYVFVEYVGFRTSAGKRWIRFQSTNESSDVEVPGVSDSSEDLSECAAMWLVLMSPPLLFNCLNFLNKIF